MRRLTAEEIEEYVAAAVRRVVELAVDGVAPTQPAYNAQRGAAPSSAVLFRHGVAWQEVLRRAGLKGALRGYNTPAAVAKRNGDRLAPGVPNAVEAEIRAAFERGDHVPAVRREWPLFAIPTRLEVREWPLADGSGVVRVTRAYASLR